MHQKLFKRLKQGGIELQGIAMLLFGFLMLVSSCKKEKETEEELNFLGDATFQYKIINGVDPNLLSLDIYTVPESKSLRPVVIWVHGGGWAVGDKSNSMENKVPFFQDQQYVFVSVNYRLSPVPYEVENENKVQYPDHVMDVADALVWIYNNIGEYGGNAEKIAIIGHSAGAHLAALVATDEYWLLTNGLEPTILCGVIPLDTEAFNLVERINRDSSALFLNAFTLDEVAWQEASPVYKIEPGEDLPPKWLVVERGTLARRAILNEFITKLESVGADVTRVVANAYSHEDVNKKIGEQGETILNPAIRKFLLECFF